MKGLQNQYQIFYIDSLYYIVLENLMIVIVFIIMVNVRQHLNAL